MNIIFALIYLVIMFVYSPPLSIVSLSTIPVYVLMIVVISPIYKSLIRKRAVAQARTQSHLIEVISGIQTVKAQHFELTLDGNGKTDTETLLTKALNLLH